MIADSETNYLYVADTLPITFPRFYEEFRKVLRACSINLVTIKGTKDVWAVDYMPIQVALGDFVQFRYEPPYLMSSIKWRNTISDVDTICEKYGIEPTKSNIILDGGNVVHSQNKVIITERVFKDNPQYEHRKLVRKLYELLKVDHIYLIPEQPNDFTGHADGMVRFIDDDTLIVNDYKREGADFYRAFELAIHNIGIDYYRIPYNVYDNKSFSQANGDYINYLEMENCVIVPIFGLNEDDVVVRQFEDMFAGKRVEAVDSNEIAEQGGVVNCVTWNIRIE